MNLLLLPVLPIALKLVEGKQLQALCQCPQKVVFLVQSPCSHDHIQLALCKRQEVKKMVTKLYDDAYLYYHECKMCYLISLTIISLVITSSIS